MAKIKDYNDMIGFFIKNMDSGYNFNYKKLTNLLGENYSFHYRDMIRELIKLEYITIYDNETIHVFPKGVREHATSIKKAKTKISPIISHIGTAIIGALISQIVAMFFN